MPGEEPGWGPGALGSSPSFVTSLVTLGSLSFLGTRPCAWLCWGKADMLSEVTNLEYKNIIDKVFYLHKL